MAIVALLAVLVIISIVGCAVVRPIGDVPSSHEFLTGQLIIHSDFGIDPGHRLLVELVQRKSDLEKCLGVELGGEPIHIYLFDDERRYRQYVRRTMPHMSDRSAMFLRTDTKLTVFAHWGDDAGNDLRHEVTHGYLHSRFDGLPLWFDEGLAEYFEMPKSTGFVNRDHVFRLAKAFRKGEWTPSLARLETVRDPTKMGQLEYAEAWLWVHLVLNDPGPLQGAIQEFARSCLQWPESEGRFSELVLGRDESAEIRAVEYLKNLAIDIE